MSFKHSGVSLVIKSKQVMKNKIIVVTGQGSDIEKVSIKKDQTIGQYFTKLENELNNTFDEGTISEFLLGPGEQIVEFEGCVCRVFFRSPENDWSIVVDFSYEVLEKIEECDETDELTEMLGLDYI